MKEKIKKITDKKKIKKIRKEAKIKGGETVKEKKTSAQIEDSKRKFLEKKDKSKDSAKNITKNNSRLSLLHCGPE